jgi:hypothetical protein
VQSNSEYYKSIPRNVKSRTKTRELINCDVNMYELQDLMNNLIRVVNQHAKLLDTVGHELAVRPVKSELGKMFNCLEKSFPEQLLQH